MNKKNNRKGFTIVELVIVIAVIAILATVLVPTFSGIVTKANDSAALQEARNELTEYLIENNASISKHAVIKADDTHYYRVVDGSLYTENGTVKVYATQALAIDGFAADTDANDNITKNWAATFSDGVNVPQ